MKIAPLLGFALLAGCVGTPNETVDAASAPTTTLPLDQPILLQGTLKNGVIACAPTQGCLAPVPADGEARNFPVEQRGNVTFTLTWDAANPAMQDLRLWLRTIETAEEIASTQGASPLVLEHDLSTTPEGDVEIAVSAPSHGQQGFALQPRADQPFTIEITPR